MDVAATRAGFRTWVKTAYQSQLAAIQFTLHTCKLAGGEIHTDLDQRSI